MIRAARFFLLIAAAALWYSSAFAQIGGPVAGSASSGTAPTLTSDSVVLDRTNRDVILLRDAANALAQRNGTNAQTFRAYGTFTDASNYVRGALSASTTAVTLAAESAGTGSANLDLFLTAKGSGVTKVLGNGLFFVDSGGTAQGGSLRYAGQTGTLSLYNTSGGESVRFNLNPGNEVTYMIASTLGLGGFATPSAFLVADAANTLAGKNGTNAQVFRLYFSTTGPVYWQTTARTNGALYTGVGGAAQVSYAQTTAPTCSSNCGTSPSVAGTDSAGIVTMGASGVPASAWVVTFNGTWPAAPACIVQSALASMVVGKMPIAVVTTTTTMTVTTNGTAPATSDKYQFHCVGVS